MRGRLSSKSSGVLAGDSSGKGSWSSIWLLKPYFKRYLLRLAGGFAALVLVDLLQLFVPRIIRYAVNSLQEGHATPRLLLSCGLYICLIAVSIAGFRFIWRHLILGFSRLVETHLRNRMFSHLLALDKDFFQKTNAGEVMALATNDLAAVQLATGMGIVALIDAVFMGLAAFGFMCYIDPRLTFIAVAPMPLLALLTRTLSSRLHGRFKKVQEQFSVLTEFVRSTISSIRLVKAYNQEEHQSRRFAQMGETYVRNNVRVAVIYGALSPVSSFIANSSMLLVLIFGGRLTIYGTITAGDFVAFISYLFLMTWPMMALGWVTDLFQRGVTSLSRIESLMMARPSLCADENAPSVRIGRGEISARKLSFRYPGQTEPVINGLDLEIPAGTLLGIVGRTGAGKTTLCNLMARLFPVEEGRLFFDGYDVNSVSIDSVRSSIAYVPQDAMLFSDTIAFNIAFGAPEASMEKIEKVARAAAIHDEISAMPEGYETRIGEKGVKLSGGQRQRIAIARALLLDRPIIIIDDGLSGVDMETEHAIIRSISSYLEGRTCIIVSHRIAPVADAHRIVVMENGRIADQGTHSELIERNTFYSSIYRHQTLVPALGGTERGVICGEP
ncbi:MAG: ABC transporter ATP-binding protein [Deltaproteobacteria bacterium]|nr:ABC transporter ATP-binding protein [Deltaproteobacteria bacterium]